MLRKVTFTMYPVEDLPLARNPCEETPGLGAANGAVNSCGVAIDLAGGCCFASVAVMQNAGS